MEIKDKEGKPDITSPAEGKQSGDTSPDNGGNKSDTPTDESAIKIADLEARLAKETKDKEVYRAGLLAAKELGSKPKITPEDLADPVKLDSAIEAKIKQDKLEQQAQTDAEAKTLEDDRLKAENEELRRTLEAAKTAGFSSPSVGSGHNENSESKPQGYWSEPQKAELRQMYQSRNLYSSEQIDTMIKRAEDIARAKSATSERGNDLSDTRPY